MHLRLNWLPLELILRQNSLFYLCGRCSRVIADLDNLLPGVSQVRFHIKVVWFAPPIFSNNKNVYVQVSAPGNIFKLVVGAYNVDAAQGFQHLYALVEWNDGDIGLVTINNFIGGNPNRNDISQCLAVV